MITYYEINEQRAKSAKSMWSFSEYVAGTETAAYKAKVSEAYTLANSVDEKSREAALLLADRYAKKLAENINKSFEIELRCPSVMISGAGNFPVSKKNKQNAARDKNYAEYKEIEKIIGKIKTIKAGSNIIKSGDADALDRLKEKLAKLEADRDQVKEYNKKARANKTEQAPWYSLPYLSRDIKTVKERIATLESAKSTPVSESKYESSVCKVIENSDIMRIQLIFDGKPDETTRNTLKSNGFKWAPSQNAWQRQLTPNGIYATKRVLKELEDAKQ